MGCEVTGRASQYVEFLLHGLSSSGEKLVTTAFNGYFNADGTADLKKTFPVEYGKFINARKWEPDRSNSSVLIAKGYIFNEKDLLLRSTEIKKEISERELQSSGSWSNRDYIAMKKGVNFRMRGGNPRQFNCRDESHWPLLAAIVCATDNILYLLTQITQYAVVGV